MKNIYFLLLCLLLTSCMPGKHIDKNKSDSYFINIFGNIYYSPAGNWLEIGMTECDADINSFKIITNEIAKDKNFVFYKGIKQVHIDCSSFYMDNGIPKDENYAYFIEFDSLAPIKNVDSKTFKYIIIDPLNRSISQDKNNYYFNFKKINVDYSTFKILNNNFSMDKDSLYVDLNGWKFISLKAISNPINIINNEYIRDNNNIYFVANLPKIHVQTQNFKSIKSIRIVSDNIICVDNKVLVSGCFFKSDSVDAYSFEIFNEKNYWCFSKDKNRVYYDQIEIKGANPMTFKAINSFFSKDDQHVYYQTKLLEGVDSKSFKETSELSNIYSDNKGNKFNLDGEKLK